jgi:hypothetical protein
VINNYALLLVVEYINIEYNIYAKTKFAKIPGSKEFQDLTASTWVNTTIL